MGSLKWDIHKAIEAKEERRRGLARLPYAEKVRIVIELQEMAAPILRCRGMHVVVWPRDDEIDPSASLG